MAQLGKGKWSGLRWYFAMGLPLGEGGPATAFRHRDHVVMPNKKSDSEHHVI